MMKLVDFTGMVALKLAKDDQSLHGEVQHGGKIHFITKTNLDIFFFKTEF